MTKQEKIWEQIWLSQDKRCAICGREIALVDTAKNSRSFEIICQDCYNKPIMLVMLDEWERI